MKFFIDTAKVEDIKAANDMGVICGVTTNPSLIAKEGRDFKEVIKEITSIVDGPISGEVKATTTDAEGMIKEGREIAAIHPNMIVKIPMTVEGLKAVKVLHAEGIKTNVTLIFTANQCIQWISGCQAEYSADGCNSDPLHSWTWYRTACNKWTDYLYSCGFF